MIGRRLSVLLAASLATAAIFPLSGQTFAPDELVVVGLRQTDNQGLVSVYRPDGTFSRTVAAPNASFEEAGFDARGFLHVASGVVRVYDRSGAFVRILPVERPTEVNAMTFASNGDVYLLWDSDRLVRLSVSGIRLAGFNLPHSTGSIDLASDQCTLYFTTLRTDLDPAQTALGRVNLCSGSATPAPTYLTYFPLAPNGAEAVRVLPDGNLLVAQGFSGVHVITPAGAIVRTYANRAAELALAADGRAFWAAFGSAPVVQVDLATGDVLRTINTGMNVRGLAVVAADQHDIPALSPWMAALLAFSLAVMAVKLLR